MPVLKATSSPIQAQVFSLRDVEKQAAAIIARAKQQAEAMLVEAQRQAAALHAEARSAGLAEGQAAGESAGRAEGAAAGKLQAMNDAKPRVTAAIEALSAGAAQIDESRHEILASAGVDLTRLAIAIARRAVHRFAAREPSLVADTLSNALKLVAECNAVKIAIHPLQQQLLAEMLPVLRLKFPSMKHVEIIADEAVAVGGARVSQGTGMIDATLDGMIDRIAAELLGVPVDALPAPTLASAASPEPA